MTGKPLAGGEVERGDGKTVVAEKDIPRFKTDAEGIAEVPIVNAGPQLLVIDHKVTPSGSPDQANTDMFNATLMVFRFEMMSEAEAIGGVKRALALRLFDDAPAHAKAKAALIGGLLVLANVAVWTWAFASFRDYPLLLGTASLAYTLGLRHAVDPDHIAAIDNVTRKLMQEGKRPIAVGLFFAMGHSTVVIAASLLVALSVGALEAKFEGFKEFGGMIGTSVSAAFLLVIAIVNMMILDLPLSRLPGGTTR